jgi:DNA-binding NarL/FixJ family response regulator
MSTTLLLSLGIGLPVLLLALGVFYHARVIAQQPIDSLSAHVAEMATSEHTDELLAELHRSMQAIRQQLSQQRDSLSGMLSDTEHAARPARSRAAPPAEPMRSAAPAVAPNPLRGLDPTTELRSAVARLVAEGLSDRAIARQLHIGLEEVRMARTRTGSVS